MNSVSKRGVMDSPTNAPLSAVERRKNRPGPVKRWMNRQRKKTRRHLPSLETLVFGTELSSISENDGSLPENQPNYSVIEDVFGQNVDDDEFNKAVVQKTQAYMIGHQEAETEVMIDRLIEREGDRDKALLYVVSKISSEIRVQEFVNILLHRGAHPSSADQKCQTPLHHAAQRGFTGVVRKLLEHNALAHARDTSKKMPFHLAFERRDDEISSMLIKSMPNTIVRNLFLCQGKKEAGCTLHLLLEHNLLQTTLAVLDCLADKVGSHGPTRVYYHLLEADMKGRPPTHPDFDSNSKSFLHLISKGGYKDLAFHFVVRLLIKRKWQNFARRRFIISAVLYLFTLMSLTGVAVWSTMIPDVTVYDAPGQVVRAVFETWCLGVVFATLIIEVNQMRKHKLDYIKDPFNWIDFPSTILLISVVPLRFSHQWQQWLVFAIGYLLWTLRIFKYAVVFRQLGAYTQILWRIVRHDVPQFLVVFAVILLAFSGTFVLTLHGEGSLAQHNETSNFGMILFTGVRILIEGEAVVEYFGDDGFKFWSSAAMTLFLFTCSVVLLNILIAQLSDTYQNVQRDAQRCVELHRAGVITRVERNSIFVCESFIKTKYIEMEEMHNPVNTLEKWDSPLLYEIGTNVRETKENLESTKLNVLTVINRLSQQEYSLSRMQRKLDDILQRLPVQEIKDGNAEATNQVRVNV